jgi:hypothetical protein
MSEKVVDIDSGKKKPEPVEPVYFDTMFAHRDELLRRFEADCENRTEVERIEWIKATFGAWFAAAVHSVGRAAVAEIVHECHADELEIEYQKRIGRIPS